VNCVTILNVTIGYTSMKPFVLSITILVLMVLATSVGWAYIKSSQQKEHYRNNIVGGTSIHGRLCIGKTCINENHLKVLTGASPITLHNEGGYALQGVGTAKGNIRYENKNRGPWEIVYMKACKKNQNGWCQA
jgi:hypothetical protein